MKTIVEFLVGLCVVVPLIALGLFLQTLAWNHIAPVFGGPVLTWTYVLAGNVVVASFASSLSLAFRQRKSS